MKTYIKSDTSDILDESYAVQWDAAHNPNTRPATLLRLTGSKYPEVRSTLALNPNLSGEVVEILSHDNHKSVRNALASNSHISTNIQFQEWAPSNIVEYTFILYDDYRQFLTDEDIEAAIENLANFPYGYTYLGGTFEISYDDMNDKIEYRFCCKVSDYTTDDDIAHFCDDGTVTLESEGVTIYDANYERLLKP